MSDEKIINRIKKMMALANDPAASDGERDNALRMSYALLTKHNLSLQDVEGQATGPTEVRNEFRETFYARPWAIATVAAVAKMFFCKYYFIRSGERNMAHHCFVGTESNAQAGLEVARVLVESIKREASRRMREEGENATWRRSFSTGAAFRIQARIRELQEEAQNPKTTGTALVLVGIYEKEKVQNELWVQNKGITLKTDSRSNTRFDNIHGNAYSRGREFANKLNLAPTKKLGV